MSPVRSVKKLGLCVATLMLCAVASAKDHFPPASELPATVEFPDPLITFSGKPVTTKRQWFTKRLPELQQLFQHYQYGYFPRAEKVKSSVERIEKSLFNGKATLKLVRLSFGPKEAPDIHLMVVVPNHRQKAAPVFVGINFRGNHTLLTNTTVPLPTAWMPARYEGVVNNRATETMRGTQVDTFAIEQTIDRGYAVATFYAGDVDPDKPDFTDGVHPHFRSVSRDSDQRGPHDWGTIAAWAWGLHRAVDYFERDRDLDAKRIAVVGHSRLGKTALVAAAYDPRISLVVANQAGCGGTAPSRSTMGERLADINKNFPHWFCNAFKNFNAEPERLPFDQHCLIAICAPRPVLLSNAIEDTWANPPGQFAMLKAAHPVYRLLGSEGLATQTMPEAGMLVDSPLGYYIRPGQHSMTGEDWKVYLDFADRHFRAEKR